MNNQTGLLFKKAKRILAQHGYRLLYDDKYFYVYSDYSVRPNRFGSLVSVVDYYKPICQDEELTAMYI